MNRLPNLSAGARRTRPGDRPGSTPARGVRAAAAPEGRRPAAERLDPAQASATARALAFELPVYGNYCGPGYGDGWGCGPAQDAVDAACCRHDACYGQLESHDCRCEKRLLGRLKDAIAEESDKGNADGAAAGSVIATVFAAKPCRCGEVGGVPIWMPNPAACL